MSGLLFFLLGLAVGCTAVFAALRVRIARLERERAAEREVRAEVERTAATLSTALELERRATDERAALKEELAGAFQALSAQALNALHQESREDLAHRQKAVESFIAPIRESLDKVDRETRALERARSEAYGRLTQQVEGMARAQVGLQRETANLVTALRAPAVRGRWGEMQLRRVVEMAGMVAQCDFVEQATTANAEGQRLRPDLVVKLPGGRNIVVDAKAPLEAYLQAVEATDDDARARHLADHARQIRDHVLKLAAKSYWEQFEGTPAFVFLFLPGEAFLSAALAQDPALLEEGYRRGVHLVTPTSLLSNLRAVAQGWRDETVAENARLVSDLAKELYDRLRPLARHFRTLGKSLDGATAAYNDAVGSLESRVLVTARKFADLGVPVAEEIPPADPLERTARALQAPELSGEVLQVSPAGERLRIEPPGAPERSDVPDAA